MKTTLYVGVAGIFGALLRVGIGQWISESSVFPIATLFVNLLATFLLVLLSGQILKKWLTSQAVRQAITTGFLGAFSTFSAFSIETFLLIENGEWLVAMLYVFISIIGGFMVAMVAVKVTEKWVVV